MEVYLQSLRATTKKGVNFFGKKCAPPDKILATPMPPATMGPRQNANFYHVVSTCERWENIHKQQVSIYIKNGNARINILS